MPAHYCCNGRHRVISYYKPVSRILFPALCCLRAEMVIIYLSSTLLLGSICLPISVSSVARTSDEQPSYADLCGISACKVYPFRQSPAGTVSSYLTFSPLPRLCSRDSYFLWHCLLPTLRRHFVKLSAGTRLFTGALLYAVRTFLPDRNVGTTTRLVAIISKKQLQK